MVSCGSKNGYQKCTYLIECGLCVHIMVSKRNRENLYDCLMSKRISTIIMNIKIHMSSTNYEESNDNLDLDFLIILY